MAHHGFRVEHIENAIWPAPYCPSCMSDLTLSTKLRVGLIVWLCKRCDIVWDEKGFHGERIPS